MPKAAFETDHARRRLAGPRERMDLERPTLPSADESSKKAVPSGGGDGQWALEAHGLSKRFGGMVVLDRVDVQVREGEIVALSGANGSGKTTLLRCLAGVYRPTGGQVAWFGRAIGSDASLQRLVGLVDHESLLYRNLTLAENLLFAARMHGLTEPHRRVNEMLESTGLRPAADRRVGQISQGMRRRLSIARALVHDPPIVLLDEPFASLDTAGTAWLVDLLKSLRSRGRAICCITHATDKLGELADRTVQLESGRLRELEPDAWDRSSGG